MLTKLTLERFKNFKKTELILGPITSLIGTNASVKSNIRDAFRFLHGIGRGYTLPEVIGEIGIRSNIYLCSHEDSLDKYSSFDWIIDQSCFSKQVDHS
jgi:AAA15 family ATPase/GTPase